MPLMIRVIRKYHPARSQMLDLIAACKEKGLQMAIYSDYGCVIDKLEALGIDPALFELKVSAPTYGALKPAEACTRRLLEQLNAQPETTLFVGDRDDKDGACARSVGAKFLLVEN
jgi:FMN phosphatase YigB (HAD superfamily)